MGKIYLKFKYIYSHILTYPKEDADSLRFFHDDIFYEEDRIKNKAEQDIVRIIFSDPSKTKLIFSEINAQQGPFFDSIPDKHFKNSIIRNGGDLDIVLFEYHNPKRAICIEIKKIKINIDHEGNEKVNNIGGIGRLIHQGNTRQSQGFYKSYICAIAVIDSHEFKTANVLVKNSHSEERGKIYNLDTLSNIHPDVGIVIMEVNQPTGASYDSFSGFGVCCLRHAAPLEQPQKLSEDCEIFLKNPDSRRFLRGQ